MKNKYLILLSLFLVFSCTKPTRFGKGEIHKVEKAYLATANVSPVRDLAQTSADVCANDDVSEERIVKDIAALESSKASGSRAIINGMDLSKFSASQAEYLEKNKEWISTSGLDLSQCTNIKCVFSKIYPNSDGFEGYINYYFYLKMGYALSTVKNAPNVALGDNYTFQDVLFSRDELKAFYYLSKALGPSFQKMSSLSSIHRLPKNVYMESMMTPQGAACGLAGGYVNKGYIILMDKCLVSSPPPKIGGTFYPLATHELSHRVDYTILPKNVIFSESQTWLDFSGWAIKENVDPATGKSVRKWQSKQPNSSGAIPDGFVRDYAANSPVEDFADSVGFARFTPNDVEKVAPRKFAWITKNLFDGKSYTSTGLSTSYLNYLSQFSMNGLPTVINNCVANKTSYTYTLNATQINDYKEFEPELIQCIFGGVNNILADGIRALKSTELEACDFFASNETILKSKVMEQMNDFIKQDLSKNIEIGLQLKTLAEFISRLNEEVDPREIFIACQEDKAPTECYSKELTSSFTTIAADYVEKIPNQLKTFQETYSQENKYIDVKSKISGLFSQIYAGSELRFKEEAKRKWDQCFVESVTGDTSDQGELLLYPYSGGSQFIKKSLLNCLNTNAENELVAALDKVGKKLGISISNQSTKKFVLEMYLSSYTGTLQALVSAESEKETVKIRERKGAVTNKVISQLTTDTSWIGNTARSNEDLASLCQQQSEGIVKGELEDKSNNFTNLIFHSAADNVWQEGTCTSVVGNSKVKVIHEANQANAIKKALTSLEGVFMDSAKATMDKCKKQFSSSNTLVLKSRGLCLTNSIAWNDIVNTALDTWVEKEKIDFISSAKKKGQDYLDGRKTDLKNTATKKMNAK